MYMCMYLTVYFVPADPEEAPTSREEGHRGEPNRSGEGVTGGGEEDEQETAPTYRYLSQPFSHSLNLTSAFQDYRARVGQGDRATQSPRGDAASTEDKTGGGWDSVTDLHPSFTNFTAKFKATLDYICHSRSGLRRCGRKIPLGSILLSFAC
jgi:mRNA deadenylase 3'-5' endonuclease subunit Ccr4